MNSELSGSTSINFAQEGFTLSGKCEVVPSVNNILIALVDDEVAGLVTLPFLPAQDKHRLDTKVVFSMCLDADILARHVGETLQLVMINNRHTVVATRSCSTLLINATNHRHAIQELAPSYGFFGGGRNAPLTLPVNQSVSSLEVKIKDEETFLNFSALRCFDEEGQTIQFDPSVKFAFSSNMDETQTAESFSQGRGFHSKLDQDPWMSLTFSQPVYISRVEVVNRSDVWGCRSARMTVTITGENKADKTCLYDPYSENQLAEFCASLLNVVELETLYANSTIQVREIILESLIERYSHCDEAPDEKESLFILAFLSTWAAKSSEPTIHKLELTLLSTYLFWLTKEKLGVTLSTFSRILPGRSDLEFIEQQINLLRKSARLRDLQITKHGMAHQGMLVRSTDRALRALHILMKDLDDMGLRPCLAYGTLLGAVREQAFISHDDDIDILVEFAGNELTRDKVYQMTEQLLADLDKEKYKTDIEVRAGVNLNIHILVKEVNIVIDIFPYWQAEGKCWLHMEKMAIRGIPSAIMQDRKSVSLYGESFPAPGKPESFLEERYGSGWTISDKYHEWPWSLKE